MLALTDENICPALNIRHGLVHVFFNAELRQYLARDFFDGCVCCAQMRQLLVSEQGLGDGNFLAALLDGGIAGIGFAFGANLLQTYWINRQSE